MKPFSFQFADGEDASALGVCREREPADYCCEDGAQTLKAMIEAYWAARGQHVMVTLQNVGFHPAIRAARFDVRSDMVNGKPRGVAKASAAAEVFGPEDAAE